MSESQIGNVLPATAGQIVVTPGTQLTSSEAEGTKTIDTSPQPEADSSTPTAAPTAETMPTSSDPQQVGTVPSGPPDRRPSEPFKQVLRSFTQPTSAKPSDGTVPIEVDPTAGVAKPHESFHPSQNFGLIGQQVKAKLRNWFGGGQKKEGETSK